MLMKYCTVCAQPDTRPNTVFLDSGVCPACNYFEMLKEVDWQERYEILQSVLEEFPRKPGQFFDCIIGVSGGKDSTRQALWVRDKLGLNPLLVCLSYPPEQITERGTNNISMLIENGFDMVISSPAPGVWKRLVQEAFNSFTNWGKSTELALFSSVPQLAIRYKIPLILWGENPGLQLGDMKTMGRTGYDGNNLRYMNTLSGGGLDWMLETGVNLKELIPYQYPSPEVFDANSLQIIYLGWFLGDWSMVNNGMYSAVSGLEIRSDRAKNTGDLLGVSCLDEDWVTLNQMIKYYKFGFGKVTDCINEEIRLGNISREDGIKQIEKYDACCSDEYIASFCDYIEMPVSGFWEKVYASVNLDLFDIKPTGEIVPKFIVGEGL
jgi:N-acetyl sugar amidotransferase